MSKKTVLLSKEMYLHIFSNSLKASGVYISPSATESIFDVAIRFVFKEEYSLKGFDVTFSTPELNGLLNGIHVDNLTNDQIYDIVIDSVNLSCSVVHDLIKARLDVHGEFTLLDLEVNSKYITITNHGDYRLAYFQHHFKGKLDVDIVANMFLDVYVDE